MIGIKTATLLRSSACFPRRSLAERGRPDARRTLGSYHGVERNAIRRQPSTPAIRPPWSRSPTVPRTRYGKPPRKAAQNAAVRSRISRWTETPFR